MPQSEQLTELLTSEAIGPVVDLDQPVDFVFAFPDEAPHVRPPVYAVSAAVKDPDKVTAALADRYKLVPGDNGVTRIEGLGKPAARNDSDDDDESDGDPDSAGADGETVRTCELATSFGAAPTRIVCAPTPQALAALAPWLTRTATRATTESDLHVEVHMAPVKPFVSSARGLMGMMLAGAVGGGGMRGHALLDLLTAVASDFSDFATDVDTATLDVSLADAAATAKARLQLSGTTSLLARLAVAHPERSGEVPATFWQFPADADFAAFDRGADEDAIAHARTLLLDAVGAGWTADGAKPADVQAVQAALGKIVTGAASEFAGGLDVDGARKAFAAERTLGADVDPAARLEARRAEDEAVLGWRVVEIDQPVASTAAALKDFATAVGRPSFVNALKGKDAAAQLFAFRPAPVGKAAGLPSGATHWVIEVPESSRIAVHQHSEPPTGRGAQAHAHKLLTAKPLVVHVFLAGDGAKTWFSLAGDESTAASRLAATLASSGDKLAGRADLAPLKTGAIGAGGFFTARALRYGPMLLRLLGGGSAYSAREMLDDFEQMPSKGLSPFALRITALAPAAGAGASSAVAADVTIPRGAIEDIVAGMLR